MKNIQVFRKRIDDIDVQILRLLNQRMQLARKIGALKRQAGSRWVDPRRERAILARLSAVNRGPLTTAGLRAIYRQIFMNTRAAQRALSRRKR